MSEIIVFNDLHLADKPPAMRTESYTAEGLALLSEVVEIANLRGAEAIVSTGDLFHIKTPWRNSHALMQQVIGLLAPARCPVYVVPGNHDLTEMGMASIHKQPLGVLHQAGLVRVLHSRLPVPVFTQSGVRLVGREYDVHQDADPRYYALRSHERDYEGLTLVFAHGSLLPPGEVRPYPAVSVADIDWTGISVIASGHIHEDLGSHRLGGGWFTNVGSLGRVAKNDSNLTRTVKVVSLSITPAGAGWGIGVEEIPLKSALPAAEIFLAGEVESGPDDDAIQRFVDSLAGGFGAEQVDLVDLVQQADVTDTIRQHLLHYLEAAGV